MEPDLEYYCGLMENGVLIAGGGYSGSVIKCLAVAEAYRGEDLLSGIVTSLYTEMRQAGRENIFIFTKPEHGRLFQSMGFSALVKTEEALLLESRKNGLPDQLTRWQAESPRATGAVGAVVMNANPFTMGHLHLLQQAAQVVELLHVFVLQEEKSAFPFAARMRMVRTGAAEITNAVVHAGGAYLISSATFPGYFLKDPSGAAAACANLDAVLFAQRIAPALNITTRFVGTEEDDVLTALYNQRLLQVLPAHGVGLQVVPRAMAAGQRIRASRVRALFAAGEFHALEAMVPPSTMEFLRSPAGTALQARVRASLC